MSDSSSAGKPDERHSSVTGDDAGKIADLYFAYGSNLDLADWMAFCRGDGFNPDSLRPVGAAVLTGEQLVFDYFSKRRQGGALNIRSARAGSVDGVLFAVAANGWTALDHKEGHPHRYRREIVKVLDTGGRALRACTYRVTPELRGAYTPPSAAYLAVCRAGRARFGLSCAQLERAAQGLDA